MQSSTRKPKPTAQTAISILDTFGPATAMHYLLHNQLHGAMLHEALPPEFFELLKKIDQSRKSEPEEPEG